MSTCCLQPVPARLQTFIRRDFVPPVGLRSLHLPGNKLSRLEGLEELTSLRELVLDGNPVKHLDSASFSGGACIRLLCGVDC